MNGIEIDIIYALASFFLSAGLVLTFSVSAILLFINHKINRAHKDQSRLTSQLTSQQKAGLTKRLFRDIEKITFLTKDEKEIFKGIIRARIEKAR